MKRSEVLASDHDFATDRGSVPSVFDLARFEEVNEEGTWGA